jgi:hypothetical protein
LVSITVVGLGREFAVESTGLVCFFPYPNRGYELLCLYRKLPATASTAPMAMLSFAHVS